MQDKPTHSGNGFDLDEWREDLLALNPWARVLTIDENNKEFNAARQTATLEHHAEGKDTWNAWANGMLALKSRLEGAGQWHAKREHPRRGLVGQNDVTRAWLGLSCAVFSTRAAPHSFE